VRRNHASPLARATFCANVLGRAAIPPPDTMLGSMAPSPFPTATRFAASALWRRKSESSKRYADKYADDRGVMQVGRTRHEDKGMLRQFGAAV